MAAVAMAVVAGAAAAAIAAAAPAVAAEPPSPESIFPGCAWGASWGNVANTETELANPELNVNGPASDASYWTLQYTYEPGETITLNGTFADARFQSFQTYGATAFANSTLSDYEIEPDRGSVNPFRQASWPFPPFSSGRHHGPHPGEQYTVTLSSEAQAGETNTLPLGPPGAEAGSSGRLLMRVYLQTGGVWAVPAPTVTFHYQGVSKTVPACSREQETFPATPPVTKASTSTAPEGPGADYTPASADPSPTASAAGGTPGEVQTPFYASASEAGVASNGDTQYLRATVYPPSNGEVLVVKGKMPSSVSGTDPRPWPSPGIDLRYWSLCVNMSGANVVNQLPDGQVDWACRQNDLVKLSHDGEYTFVIGTEAQRAAIERIPGATFAPFSLTKPTGLTALLIRNMLPSASFAHVIEGWPKASTLTPAEAAAADEQALGAYYPKLSWSTISALEPPPVVSPPPWWHHGGRRPTPHHHHPGHAGPRHGVGSPGRGHDR